MLFHEHELWCSMMVKIIFAHSIIMEKRLHQEPFIMHDPVSFNMIFAPSSPHAVHDMLHRDIIAPLRFVGSIIFNCN